MRATDAGLPETYERDLAEYQAPRTIRRYRTATAGEGINYLSRVTYGPLLLAAATQAIEETGAERLRFVEFGCGVGMATQHLVTKLSDEGIELELAVGADFAPAMVAAATEEARAANVPDAGDRVRFVVASNEHLADGLADGLGEPADSLAGTFQLAFGINTFRYPIRHGTAREAVEQLERLLTSGGRVVVIDMNDRFPYGLRPKFRRDGRLISFGSEKLPTLDEYAKPLADAGFEILRKEYFAWIPHSASGVRFRVARAAAPILDKLVPDRAMRSLVVARKR